MAIIKNGQAFAQLTNFSEGIAPDVTNAVENASTGGTATWNMPFQGDTYKKVIMRLTDFEGTGTITFPTAFTFTPVTVETSPSLAQMVNSLSTTACDLSTPFPVNGFIILEGF